MKNCGFAGVIQNSLGKVSHDGATTIIRIYNEEYLVKLSARSDVIPS